MNEEQKTIGFGRPIGDGSGTGDYDGGHGVGFHIPRPKTTPTIVAVKPNAAL